MRLLHIHLEILALAAEAQSPPALPAPPEIAPDVDAMIKRGLLSVGGKGCVVLTAAGRAALEQAGRPLCDADAAGGEADDPSISPV
jgi:hypothetical protein